MEDPTHKIKIFINTYITANNDESFIFHYRKCKH